MKKITFTLSLIVLCLFGCFGQSITLSSLSTYSLCGGSTNLTVSYTLSGAFVSNQVRVELSDKDGSFANPQTLATSSSNPISVSIPSSNSSGINYKIRLVTISPVVLSVESSAITFSKITSLNIYNTQNDNITYNELNIMCTGRVLTITTALTDTSGMVFQWKKDGVNISQSGNYSKYRLSSQARYTVSATQGTCPTVNSPYGPYVYYYNTINWSTVVVVNGSTTQCNGNGVGLFAAAHTDSITYQWYRDNTPISGATSRNYTATQSGVYKYVGLDGGCNYNGSTSPLTIVPPTTISVVDTMNHNTTNVCVGASVKLFTAVIGGNNTSITYSWMRNNTNIIGANGSTYLANQAGIYKAVATQSNCVTNSSTYTLNQTQSISNPTITFADSVKCTGQTINLSSNSYFSNSAIFQWKKNNLNISGANSINYLANSTGNYKLSIIDNSCSAESLPVSLRISDCVNLPDGLVAHYNFNGNANDQSGYNNNPIANNAILTSNRFCENNSAYRFQGYFNQNRMDIPSSASLTFNDTLSFSGFVKINNWEGMDNNGGYSSDNGFHPIFAKSHDRSGLWCSIIKNLDSLVIYVGNNIFDYGVSKFQIRTAVKGNYLNRWMQIGVVLSKTQLKVYLDGNKIKTANVSLDMTTANSKPLHFGMYGDTQLGWYPLNGDLDDIRFYKRLLNDTEMKALYQEGEAGRVVTSIQSGKWEEGTTWDCGRLPTILNQTIIQNGHIVNLSTTNSIESLILHGSLDFKIGGNLTTSQ